MKGTVYKYTFSDGKVYIGKSIHANLRKVEHFDKTMGLANPRFYEAYRKLGKPSYEVLFEEDFGNILEREVTLCGIERYYINYYRATDPDFGYNIRNMSPFTPGMKKEIDLKVEEIYAQLVNERLKEYLQIENKLLGKKEKLTPAELFIVKQKYREKNIWRDCFDNFNFEDYSLNSDDEYDFMIDEALPMIKCIIETDTKTDVSRYVWDNADEIFNDSNDKTILKINELGEIVKEYGSLNDICDDLKIVRPDNIRYVLKGKQKTAYGYFWMYKKNYEEKKKELRDD